MDFVACVEEHEKCLGGMDEEKSDQVKALLDYRDFLSTGDPLLFATFLASYGEFVLKSWVPATGRRLARFTTNCLTRIFGGNDHMTFTEIISDQGFQNIALAIRKSTINEAYLKASGRQVYEIRYGLGQDLRRRARKKEDFLTALATFVQSYNEENCRISERPGRAGHFRADILRDDLASAVKLIETSPHPEAVALLLVGFGFAKQSDEPDDQTHAGPLASAAT